MCSLLFFFISVAHWVAIGNAYALQWKAAFTVVFLYPSPVLLFFTFLKSAGLHYSGETTNLLIFSAAYNALKYGLLGRSLIKEGLNFSNVAGIIAEGIYLASSSLYLIYYSYL